MSALHEARVEGAYLTALERAGGDIERLARGLMRTCISLASENEALRELIAERGLGPKPKRKRSGSPKASANPLPLDTKEHGRRGFKLKRQHRGMTCRDAAMLELIANEISPADNPGLWANLQKRISEAEKTSEPKISGIE